MYNRFYIANIDGKRVVMQYGLEDKTKSFLTSKIKEMDAPARHGELVDSSEQEPVSISIPEFAEL